MTVQFVSTAVSVAESAGQVEVCVELLGSMPMVGADSDFSVSLTTSSASATGNSYSISLQDAIKVFFTHISITAVVLEWLYSIKIHQVIVGSNSDVTWEKCLLCTLYILSSMHSW